MRISVCRFCKVVSLIAAFVLLLFLISIFNIDSVQKDTNFSLVYKRSYGRQLSIESGKQVVESLTIIHRKTNGIPETGFDGYGKKFKNSKFATKNGGLNERLQSYSGYRNVMRKTAQSDIHISIKTTKLNRKKRLNLLLETWIALAKDETFIITDNDEEIPGNIPADHFIKTECSDSHYRQGLCCKMGREYDVYMDTSKRWFCHVDDDNYLNVPALVRFLQKYNHSELWYLGKPSINHPIEVLDRANPGQKLAFWFATGGAGFCISRGLANKILGEAGGGRISSTGDQIRLPDDCTLGYIINYTFKVPLTRINEFHSHLEGLHRIPVYQLSNQLTFSYSNSNVVEVKGYSKDEDPTRFRTIHCYLYPYLQQCADMPR